MGTLQKINRAVAEMANNFNLGVGEGDSEEPREVFSEKMTHKESLELEQERIAEEEARIKETTGEEKEEPQRSEGGLSEAFADLDKLLKKCENLDPYTERFSLAEKSVQANL